MKVGDLVKIAPFAIRPANSNYFDQPGLIHAVRRNGVVAVMFPNSAYLVYFQAGELKVINESR